MASINRFPRASLDKSRAASNEAPSYGSPYGSLQGSPQGSPYGRFGIAETHGILLRPEAQVVVSSDRLGWKSLYASTQREAPYSGRFDAVRDLLLVLHLSGPVPLSLSCTRSVSHQVIPAGGFTLLPGGTSFNVSLEAELSTIHIYLRKALVEEVAVALGLDPATDITPRIGAHDPLVEQLVHAVREALERDERSDVYMDAMARALAARLLWWQPAMDQDGLTGGVSWQKIERAIEYMRVHLDASLSVAEIANSIGIGADTFARAFKTAKGVPPHQYLITLRVEHAKRLLVTSADSIVNIALECGFSHQEHLTRVFHRAAGLTPACYRRQYAS